jgi:sugar phosphate permease
LVTLALLMGSTYHSFGVFVLPVSRDLELSRAQTNTALILFSIGNAIWAPIVGPLLDRLPVRRIMLVCSVLMGASLVALGRSGSMWLSAIVIAGPLALATQGAGTLTATTLVARWFSVHRGRAMAIALVGMSLGGMLITPLLAAVVERIGWRETLVVLGGVVGLVLVAMVPIARDRPGPGDVEVGTAPAAGRAPRDDAAADAQPLAATSLLRMASFWTLGVSAALTLGVVQAVMVTLVPLAQGAGVSATQAAGLVSVLSTAGLVGNLCSAWVADRVDRIRLLAGLAIAVALVNGLFYLGDGYAMLATGAALMGLIGGLVSPAFFALIADRFGAASFGTAHGLMTPILTVVAALCVRYAGEVFDRTGGYDLLFVSFAASQGLAALLLFCTRNLAAQPTALLSRSPTPAP